MVLAVIDLGFTSDLRTLCMVRAHCSPLVRLGSMCGASPLSSFCLFFLVSNSHQFPNVVTWGSSLLYARWLFLVIFSISWRHTSSCSRRLVMSCVDLIVSQFQDKSYCRHQMDVRNIQYLRYSHVISVPSADKCKISCSLHAGDNYAILITLCVRAKAGILYAVI